MNAEWMRRYSPVVLLVAPLLALAILTDVFGTVLFERIVIVMFINLILVLGLQMFMGNSGVLSFAHIGFMGIGAYASILFSMTPQVKAMAIPELYPVLMDVHLPFLPSLLIGAGVAALVAAVAGFPLMRLSDAASVIATFALLVIIHVILVNWDQVTNGPRTVFGIDQYTTLWVSAFWGMLFIAVAYLFKESSLGLKLRASREDEQAAAAIGINIVIVRWVAFTLSAFVVGVGGALWAHFITSFSPNAFYLKETFLIIAMLIIGGTDTVSGAVVGTLAVTVIFEGLRNIENAINLAQVLPRTLVGFTEVFLATAMIVILILRPSGIMGGRELSWPRRPSSKPGRLATGASPPRGDL